jgi:tetratricopeptide (TPR) repeat protein
MKKTLSLFLLLWSVNAVAQRVSGDAVKCRDLVASIRPPLDEGDEGRRYLNDADTAYRDCRGSNLPLDVRVNALLKYAIASGNREQSQAAIAAIGEAIELLDHARDADTATLIEVLSQAAFLETRAGLRNDATAHGKRAVDARIKKYGRNSAETAEGWVNLAMVYVSFDEYAKSEALLRDAIRVAQEACGPECETLVHAYSGMEALYAAQGKTAEAKKYAELGQNAVPAKRARNKE